MVSNPFTSGISAKLTADASDMISSTKTAQSTVDELGDEATTTSADLSLLAGRTDNLSDQFSQLTRRAFIASTSLGAVSAASTSASTAFSLASTAASASLILAMGALATALGPVAVALGGVAAGAGALAAAFGTVMATGFLAYGTKLSEQAQERRKQVKREIKALEQLKKEKGKLTKAQQKRLEQLKKTSRELKSQTSIYGALAHALQPAIQALKEVALTIGQRFMPVIRDAIQALPNLIRSIGDAIGPLDAFRDSLRRMGRIAMRVIPAIIGGIFDLARTALPIFNDFLSFLLNKGPKAFNSMRRATAKLFPKLQNLAGAVLNILPPLFRFGTVVASRLLPVLSDLLRKGPKAFNKLRAIITDLWPSIRRLAKTALDLLPTVIKLGRNIATLVAPTVATLTKRISDLVRWFKSLKQPTQTAVKVLGLLAPVLLGITGPVGAVIGAVAALSLAWDRNLFGMRDTLKQVFTAVQRTLSNAEKWWKSHQTQIGRILGKAKKIITNELDIIQLQFKHVVKPILERATRWWKDHSDQILRVLRKLSTLVNKILKHIETAWKKWGDEVTTIVKFVSDVIFGTLSSMLDLLETLLDITLAAMRGDWTRVWNEILGFHKRTLRGILNFSRKWGTKLLKWLGGVVNDVIKWFQKLAKKLIGGSIVPRMFNNILSEAKQFGSKFVGALSNMAGKAVSAVKSGLSGLFQAGKSAMGDLAAGIRSKIGDIRQAAAAAVSAANINPGGGGGGGGGNIDIPQSGAGLLDPTNQTLRVDGSGGTQQNNQFNIDVTSDTSDGETVAKDISKELRSQNFNGPRVR